MGRRKQSIQKLDAFFLGVQATTSELGPCEKREIAIVVAREALQSEVCKLAGGWRLLFHFLDELLMEILGYVKSLRAEVQQLREELAEVRRSESGDNLT
jgi:hypothetical protein